MNFDEFLYEFKQLAEKSKLKIENEKIEKFYNYMLLIQVWNEKINLTAITKPREVIIKHFLDSLTIANQIEDSARIIDIGTGAGFPGIPLKIYNDSLKITLLDSLNKRAIFLKEVVDKLKLQNVEIIHGRAEDFAQNLNYREKYNIAVSRAVAPLNILLEYMIPYVKVGGKVIAMKGSNAIEEINESENALIELNSSIKEQKKIFLPEESGERCIIVVEKDRKTPKKYPRKAGIPKKQPL